MVKFLTPMDEPCSLHPLEVGYILGANHLPGDQHHLWEDPLPGIILQPQLILAIPLQ